MGLSEVVAQDLYPAEDHDGQFAFRWSEPMFELAAPRPAKYVTLRLATPNQGVRLAPSALQPLDLLPGWQLVDLEVPASGILTIAIDPPFVPGNGDDRALGVMLRDVVWHDEFARHQQLADRHLNAVANDREFRAGTTELTSVPPLLRLTSSKTCNIANEKPCVYCAWDWTKEMERGAPDQTPSFFDELGRFHALANAVTDCSFGELPLERHFTDVVARNTAHGRVFEFTSNGQTLGPRIRSTLLGREIMVHVSLDGAKAATYANYRDHRFDMIIRNLRALCQEKKAHDNLPEVSVSFIVMKSNIAEVLQFLDLMKDVGVDRVTLRNLYSERALDGLKTQHRGFSFDYDQQRLSLSELSDVGRSALTHGEAIGLKTILEWNDFPKNVTAEDEELPLCSEPWKTAYVLNRGIMPCCYGREPIVKWDQVDRSVSLEKGIEGALNSAQMQDLRRDLAQGKLGVYCEHARSCPIVRARNEVHTRPDRQEVKARDDGDLPAPGSISTPSPAVTAN